MKGEERMGVLAQLQSNKYPRWEQNLHEDNSDKAMDFLSLVEDMH